MNPESEYNAKEEETFFQEVKIINISKERSNY